MSLAQDNFFEEQSPPNASIIELSEDEFFSVEEQILNIVSLVLYSLILVIGIAGNVLVCYVTVGYPDMRRNTFHLLLANLSLADLLVLVTCVPHAMMNVFSAEQWNKGLALCKTTPIIKYAVAHVSILNILAISVERWLAIQYPLKVMFTPSRHLMGTVYITTRNRILFSIISIWIIGLVSSAPFAWIARIEHPLDVADVEEVGFCRSRMDDEEWKVHYLIAIVILFFGVPFVLLCIVYAFIARHFLCGFRVSHGPTRSLRARKKVVLMLATVVLTFFMSHLPFRILSLWPVISHETIDQLGVISQYSLLYAARFLFYLNSVSHPIILYCMSRAFRHKFRHILCCRPLPVDGQVTTDDE
ncbi:hypothetical protein BV898_02463 [Hypsibius exemplaris]|uniref:G-protein coupled receptors family 1 profile domain-containing protein n=1 Tax=Hypsibius exemplaris TaxID=2072580 RepID=A0A1W0X853_HYPEX|nr:hypothetical protein BV898_02463 [Hypsibius exemplaris]